VKRVRPFWFAWALTGLLGAVAGSFLGWALLRMYQVLSPFSVSLELLSIFLHSPFVGLGMGIGQWLVLRSRLRYAGWWIAATTLGWMFGLAVDFLLQRRFTPTPWQGFVFGGLYLGSLQWLILFRQVRNSRLWILASVAAWTVAAVVVIFTTGPLNRLVSLSNQVVALSTLTWAVAALAYGLLSGPALSWLLKNRR
jgi:hypothetical protein